VGTTGDALVGVDEEVQDLAGGALRADEVGQREMRLDVGAVSARMGL
jgi:hypothetical protein